MDQLKKQERERLQGSLFHKLDVIRRLENGSIRKIDAARELGLHPANITHLLTPQNIEKIKTTINDLDFNTSRKRMRLRDHPEVD